MFVPRMATAGLLMTCLGCNLLMDGSEQCRDKECDAARWLILSLSRDRVDAETQDRPCFLGYRVEFVKPEASQGFIIPTSFSVRRSDLRLAVTTNDGVLHLSAFGRPEADAELTDRNALAVAWSPSGDRLAVLSGDLDAQPLDLELLILTADLDVLDAAPVGDRPAFESRPTSYHLAWSPDASRIAVTSSDDSAARLVSLATNEIGDISPAFNAAFLSAQTLVVESGATGVPRLERLRLDESGAVSRTSLHAGEFLFDSDPDSGVLLTGARFGLGYGRALRTSDLGPNILGSMGGGDYRLIPLSSQVQQILSASADLLHCAE